MKIVLASNNQGKLLELQAMFANLNCELVAQSKWGLESVPEPHPTFIENALTKARHAAKQTGLAAIADDAGLCVDAFGGLPGVDTAFYATQFGYEKNDANNVHALLEQMKGIHNRRANLLCTLVAVRHVLDPEPLIAQGRLVGQITQQPMGNEGFGFDPIMYIEPIGKTLAQLSASEKNTISHRGLAAKQLYELIKTQWLLT